MDQLSFFGKKNPATELPKFDLTLLPFLQILESGIPQSMSELVAKLSKHFGLGDAALTVLLASGQSLFRNRISWAGTYLKKAGLVSSNGRGLFSITEQGKQVLETKPPVIDAKYLEQFESFRAFKMGRKNDVWEDNMSDLLDQLSLTELLQDKCKSID